MSHSKTSGPHNISRRYCLISPCRNEAALLRKTLNAVVNQSVPPSLWVIVDDGSTDMSWHILDEYAKRIDYIRVLRREDRGRRRVGPGVVEAFYAGYDTIDATDLSYLGKLDLDLDLPPHYFEILIKRMESDPRIGTCSGKPFFIDPRGKPIAETCGDEMSVGMIKFYRMACFEQIGGFIRQVMWDGIDCHRCRQLGWIACSWDDPELRFTHLRPMGSSEHGIWTGRKRHGSGQYFMGTGWLYMTVSAIYRMAHRPYITGGLAIWWGYFVSMLARKSRYKDNQFRRFLRRYQWDCLWRGKKKATEHLNRQQASVWNPDRAPQQFGASSCTEVAKVLPPR